MKRETIIQHNIYMGQKFTYVHRVTIFLLCQGENIKAIIQYIFLNITMNHNLKQKINTPKITSQNFSQGLSAGLSAYASPP